MIRRLLRSLVRDPQTVSDRWLRQVTEFDLDLDEPFDVHSFRAKERLKVHEARTEADVWSHAGRARVLHRNLMVYRCDPKPLRRGKLRRVERAA
jgi:hypothetical protein